MDPGIEETSDFLWGIDLGGTKVEGVVLDPNNDKEFLFRERLPTEADKGYEHVLNQIVRLINKMEQKVGIGPSSIGVGTPGIIDPENDKLKNSSNAVCLNGKPIKRDLEEKLGSKVYMANDAHCFVLAETRYGIVKQKYPHASAVFGAIMGTGVGGGLVINDQLVVGHHGIGGEWGHNFLDESGYECFCGKKGCVEKVISGPALERFYAENSGTTLPLEQIEARAEQGDDQVAEETIKRLLTFFGKAVAVVVNIVDPDVIVVGGGVSNIDRLFTDGSDQICAHIFNDSFNTPILKPKLGDAAGVVGAAYLTQ